MTSDLRFREGDQPLPEPNDEVCVQDEVIKDLLTSYDWAAASVATDVEARKVIGVTRYGTILQPFNNRDAARDAYEELLDFVVYAKQKVLESDERGWRTAYDQGQQLLVSFKKIMSYYGD